MTRAELQRESTLRSIAASAAYWRDRGMIEPAATAERLLAEIKARKVQP